MKQVLLILLVLTQTLLFSQITIDIHPNFKHRVGDVDTFNRTQMMKIHADQTENEWTTGNNLGDFVNLRDTFLNGNDVYLGRNTGGISWNINQVTEDPTRPGFADPASIASRGLAVKNSYSNNLGHQSYEFRNELVIAGQQRPFYPDGTTTSQGWALANGTATGEYMGRYVNEFHGGIGQPKPAYIEIMNEPLYELVDEGPHQPIDIFNFHNDAADAIREQVSDIPIGGYCAAFPNFEVRNFERWHERWKLFMDTSGDKMDFWSIHFYDFNGNDQLRRGANLEATFEMIDYYSLSSFGEIKPYVISEYGGRARNIESQPWSAYRDWQSLKSWTSMLLTFSERPQDVLSAIPFVIVKALWGIQDNGNPYPWRLMRQAFEAPGETGTQWVYTDMVKFFELWSEVKGTRIDTRSTDPDIQCNAFVDGNKMYLILNNLYFEDTEVNLNRVDNQENTIQNIRVKHLHLDAAGEIPLLDENNFSSLDKVTIGSEAAMIIEYTYANDVLINELVEETKYFADTYLTPIEPSIDHIFNINGVDKGEQGEAVLRLGMGRPHGKDLQPIVKVNGFEIPVPSNYAGYNQAPKGSWFGIIEIPVPLYYLKSDNVVSVRFGDSEGHISTVALRMYNHSDFVFRSDYSPVTDIQLLPVQKFMLPNTDFKLIANLTPSNASEPSLTWMSSNNSVATVDSFGNLNSLALGETMITVIEINSGLTSTSLVNVVDSIPSISVFGLDIQPKNSTISPNETLTIQATISPSDATNMAIDWTVADSNIATVNANGLVQGNLAGTTQITATTEDGGVTDISTVTVVPNFATNAFCSILPTELESKTTYDLSFGYSSGFNSDVIVELRDGDNMILGQGQTTGTPGFSNVADIQINLSTAPEIGDDYSFHLFIKAENIDTTLFTCVQSLAINEILSTTTVELTHLTIHPNPSTGTFTLEVPNYQSTMTIEIVNIIGESILKQNITGITNLIECRNTPSGLYFVKINSTNGSMTKRIIIE